MANENSAAGSRSASTRDRSYGGGYNRDGRSNAGGGNRWGARYESRPIATGPMSWNNAGAMINNLAPGGMIRNALGIGPQYDGVTINSGVGHSYDPTNRAMQTPDMMGQGPMSYAQRAGLYQGGSNQVRASQGLQYRPPASKPAPAPQGLMFNTQYTQPKFIGDTTPGLAPYGFQSTPWRFVKP